MRTVGTKDAAVSWLGPKKRPAVNAFIEKLASVRRHCLELSEAANRANQDGFKDNIAHTRFSYAPWKGNLRPS